MSFGEPGLLKQEIGGVTCVFFFFLVSSSPSFCPFYGHVIEQTYGLGIIFK